MSEYRYGTSRTQLCQIMASCLRLSDQVKVSKIFDMASFSGIPGLPGDKRAMMRLLHTEISRLEQLFRPLAGERAPPKLRSQTSYATTSHRAQSAGRAKKRCSKSRDSSDTASGHLEIGHSLVPRLALTIVTFHQRISTPPSKTDHRPHIARHCCPSRGRPCLLSFLVSPRSS